MKSRDEYLTQKRGNDTTPIEQRVSMWDRERSVRLQVHSLERRDIGLATTCYSYNLTYAEQQDAARRLSALWNLATAHGWTTEQIEQAYWQAVDTDDEVRARLGLKPRPPQEAK